MNLSLNSIIPETGEWTLSPNPDDFVITLINDTGLLKEYDRIAIIARLGQRLDDMDAPEGCHAQEVHIHDLYTVEGRVPGEKLPHTAEGREFCVSVQARITAMLNKWAEETPMEKRMSIWMMDRHDPMELLQQVLSGKFTA